MDKGEEKLSYDKRIPIRLTSDQLRLIDEAAEKSYHSRRSDWMRAALMDAAERELRRNRRNSYRTNGGARQCQVNSEGDES